MARKTFGRGGQPIIVGVDEAGSDPIRIVEFESIEQPGIDDAGVESSNTSGNTVDEPTGDFEPIGKAFNTVDPSTIGEQPAKRRKPRGPNKPKQTQSSPGVITANLEKILYGLHKTAAGMLSEPDLEISTDEAKLLAETVTEVANAYDFTAILSPKTQALIDLGIACSVVYGHRIMKIAKRTNKHPMRVVSPIGNSA